MQNVRIALADIEAAAKRIAPYVKRTPIMTSGYIDDRTGKQVFFKCENFQKIGAFKYRGATNAVILFKDQASKVVTHSSGNHAQALALAAKVHGLEAHIVMPSNAPATKTAAVAGYGAQIYECFPSQEAREEMTRDLVEKLGAEAVYVPPYDHPYIIAGAGTLGLEILEEIPDLDAIVVPVGGGGMLSGICVAIKSINPAIKIFAAEPLEADDCARSFAAKKRLLNAKYPTTIADGLRVNVGEVTWPIIRDSIDDAITVTEEEIVEATRLTFERMKLVIETSAGVGVAALLTEKFQRLSADVKKVAVVLCGGNIDLQRLPWIK